MTEQTAYPCERIRLKVMRPKLHNVIGTCTKLGRKATTATLLDDKHSENRRHDDERYCERDDGCHTLANGKARKVGELDALAEFLHRLVQQLLNRFLRILDERLFQ